MIPTNVVMEYASQLQPLPQTASKLATCIADEHCSVDEIATVIEFDPVLTAEVLRYANSVMSASTRKIESVKSAVIRMGAARILERIIAGHLQEDMMQPIGAYGLLSNELWRHSMASAVIAESLGAFTGMQVTGIVFTAALLHDIGKLLIGKAVGSAELSDMLQIAAKDENLAYETIEYQRIGVSHAQIGALLCSAWNLPDKIMVAVRDHHKPGKEDDLITDCVKLCNMTAKVIGEGIGYEGMAFTIDVERIRKFGFCKDSYEAFCANARCKFNEVIEFFGAGNRVKEATK